MPSSRRGWGPVPVPQSSPQVLEAPACLLPTAAGGEESQVPLGLAEASFFLRPPGLGTQSAKIKANRWLDPYLGPRRGCHPGSQPWWMDRPLPPTTVPPRPVCGAELSQKPERPAQPSTTQAQPRAGPSSH